MMILNRLKTSLFLLLIAFATVSVAKQDNQYLLTESTYKSLSSAQVLMEEEKYSQAQKQLKSLLKETEAGSYDRAVVLQTMGYLYSNQGDYKKATVMFQQALDLNALPKKVNRNLHYNLAQLLLADENYQQGITLLEQWIKTEPSPPTSAYVLLASAHYQSKAYKQAIIAISTAIKQDKQAKETWYQLLLSANLEIKHYKSAIKVLETLITKYPYKKIYWSQLSALYLQQNKEYSALSVSLLAQRLELGDAKTLLNLVEMYRYLHIPYKAASLLSQAIDDGVVPEDKDNLNVLASSWLAAKEGQKAADVYQQLSLIDQSGEADLQYGRVLFGLEQWQNAVKPLTKSVDKLDNDKRGEALLLLGMTQFHLNDLHSAKKQFSDAVAYENERNQAGQWLRHVETQLKEVNDEAIESGTT